MKNRYGRRRPVEWSRVAWLSLLDLVKYTKTPLPDGWLGRSRHDARQQWVFAFPNGYGASVFVGWGVYGTPSHPYEVEVLHGDEPCYASPHTVIGYVKHADVGETLTAIAVLPAKPDCQHDFTATRRTA
jgi:hypothetical protein